MKTDFTRAYFLCCVIMNEFIIIQHRKLLHSSLLARSGKFQKENIPKPLQLIRAGEVVYICNISIEDSEARIEYTQAGLESSPLN